MAYRSSSSSTASSNAPPGNSAFTLPASTATGAASGTRPGGSAGNGPAASNASVLLSAFNNPATSAPGSAGQRTTTTTTGSGLGGNSTQAQAAFLNAGPNRTVSNVGAQAAQGGLGTASAAVGGAAAGSATSGGVGAFGSPNPPASGINDLSLDPSDFPALGSGSGQPLSNNTTPASNLLSSYATQVGAGSSNSIGSAPFFSNPGAGAHQQSQSQQGLSSDDFPALGGESQHVNGFSQQQQQRASQEQASAAAALAHRQNLLGSMTAGQQNQARSVANAAASTVLQDDGQAQKRNYASKLGSASSSLSPYPANSTLPPPSSNSNAPSSQHSPHQGSANGISQILEGSSPSSQATAAQLSNMLLQQHLAATKRAPPPPLPQTPAQQVLYSPADRFGLLGLLNIIKLSADADFGLLSLGTDLEKLGLDLGSSNSLHSSFITPWADSSEVSSIEPEYHLPSCYNVQPPPASSKTGAFSDETLFFIFYSQPRDAMQEAAAEQLYKRNWRYHKDLHLWLTKDAGSEPTQKTATYERGTYIFFDPNTWEKVQKEFVLVFEHLETRHRGQQGQAGETATTTTAKPAVATAAPCNA